MWVPKAEESPQLRATLRGHSDSVSKVAISQDGRTLASACTPGGEVKLWDVVTRSVLTTLAHEDEGRVNAIAFSPDGRTLAMAVGNRISGDRYPGLIVLWDAATGQRLATLTGHTSEVFSVAFSPDGRMLASGGRDKTVRIWDVTGESTAKEPADKE